MEIHVLADGTIRLHSVPDHLFEMLEQLGDVIQSDDERTRERMLPRAFAPEEDEENAQWRRLTGDDLMHLFASRAEVIKKTLSKAEYGDAEEPGWELDIPQEHVTAWENALNGACHALHARYELPDDAIWSIPDPSLGMERVRAVAQLNFYSMLLQHLLYAEGYEEPEDKSFGAEDTSPDEESPGSDLPGSETAGDE